MQAYLVEHKTIQKKIHRQAFSFETGHFWPV